jgi:hypothetical protein
MQSVFLSLEVTGGYPDKYSRNDVYNSLWTAATASISGYK